jgi:hypothetical protein
MMFQVLLSLIISKYVIKKVLDSKIVSHCIYIYIILIRELAWQWLCI